MTSCLIENRVEKYLRKNPAISESILKKIIYCLDKHLLEKLTNCNKHQLKGKYAEYWRLHVPHNHVIIYSIEGTRPNRYAVVHKILPEEEYHNRL